MSDLPHNGSGVKPPEVPEFAIARLELHPGDWLILRSRKILPIETHDRIRKVVKDAFPANRCLILENGLELAVLTASELQQLEASAT